MMINYIYFVILLVFGIILGISYGIMFHKCHGPNSNIISSLNFLDNYNNKFKFYPYLL